MKKVRDEKYPVCKCDFCNIDIPLSSALTPEGMNYVLHFCGTGCFEKWKKIKPEQKEK